MKNAIYWIFRTNIGRLITSMSLAAISLFLANYIDWMLWVAIGFFAIFPLPWFLVSMVYAWIINPIRDKKERKRQKQLVSNFNNWIKTVGSDPKIEYNALLNRYIYCAEKMNALETYKSMSELQSAMNKV